MPPKKGASAYFLFCGENRASVREECEKASDDGKASVTVVAKRLGELWKNLSAEDKERYQKLAAEKNAAAAEQDQGGDEDAAAGEDDRQEDQVILHPKNQPFKPSYVPFRRLTLAVCRMQTNLTPRTHSGSPSPSSSAS